MNSTNSKDNDIEESPRIIPMQLNNKCKYLITLRGN